MSCEHGREFLVAPAVAISMPLKAPVMKTKWPSWLDSERNMTVELCLQVIRENLGRER